MAHPRIAISKSSDGQFIFNLTAGNGQIILVSERYTSHAAAVNGAESVKENAPLDERYERKTSKADEPYFVLKAANHQVIGTSEMYSGATAMENGIASVKENAPKAPIEG